MLRLAFPKQFSAKAVNDFYEFANDRMDETLEHFCKLYFLSSQYTQTRLRWFKELRGKLREWAYKETKSKVRYDRLLSKLECKYDSPAAKSIKTDMRLYKHPVTDEEVKSAIDAYNKFAKLEADFYFSKDPEAILDYIAEISSIDKDDLYITE